MSTFLLTLHHITTQTPAELTPSDTIKKWIADGYAHRFGTPALCHSSTIPTISSARIVWPGSSQN